MVLGQTGTPTPAACVRGYDLRANNNGCAVTPEEKARQEIDRQLAACGWLVQDHKAMNIMAGWGVSLASQAVSQIDVNDLRASRLRQSILKRAFEGKLVPRDPNDEPASVLLERIRDARAAEGTQRAHKRRKSPA